MKVTMAKVEKIMDRADVSYEVANEALEAADGSLLDAIIALEKAGKFGPNAGRARTVFYSTGSNVPATVVGQAYGSGSTPHEETEPNFTMGSGTEKKRQKSQSKKRGAAASGFESGFSQTYYYNDGDKGPRMYKDESTDLEDGLVRFFRWLGRVFHASITNFFEIWRRGERIFYFPVILFLFCFIPWVFWVMLGLLLLGFFCGCKYRFAGPHLGRKNVNETMNKASEPEEGTKD